MTNYKFNAPAFEVSKSYRENGQMYLEGIASTVDIDQTGERMSPEVIAKMAARLIGKPLRSEHGRGWDDKIGEIIKADIISDDQGNPCLWIKARLHDWSSKARDLFSMLTTSGERIGLSVAGLVKAGGIVQEFVDAIGKWIPTYKDVDPTEVSVTDHPANLSAFALAVSKSYQEQREMEFVRLLAKSEPTKPEEYSDIDDQDFLDVEKFKYPVDGDHLTTALTHFNKSGQREAGGYSTEQWAQMGNKLAGLVAKATSKKYGFDPSKECVTVIKKVKKKPNMQKTKLASKKVSSDVADLVKKFNGNMDDVEVIKSDEPKKEEVVITADKPVDPEIPTVEAKPEDPVVLPTTEKNDSPTVADFVKGLEDFLAKFKESVTKTETKPAEVTKSMTKKSAMAQEIKKLSGVITEMQKSQAELLEKVNSIPQNRKSQAVEVVEKTMVDATQKVDATLAKMQADPKVSFADVQKYKNFGILPAEYVATKQ